FVFCMILGSCALQCTRGLAQDELNSDERSFILSKAACALQRTTTENHAKNKNETTRHQWLGQRAGG
ncbi:MAG: hypothetical protein AAF745_16240, partial [Planctomycetota bacterium]